MQNLIVRNIYKVYAIVMQRFRIKLSSLINSIKENLAAWRWSVRSLFSTCQRSQTDNCHSLLPYAGNTGGDTGVIQGVFRGIRLEYICAYLGKKGYIGGIQGSKWVCSGIQGVCEGNIGGFQVGIHVGINRVCRGNTGKYLWKGRENTRV